MVSKRVVGVKPAPLSELTPAESVVRNGKIDTEGGAVSRLGGMASGSALLVVKRGPNVGLQLLLDRPVSSAGRNDDSDIFLDDVTVSRQHAEFRLQNGEIRVVDLGSLNGTYVNHEPVDSAVVANGDEIQMGKFRLVFLSGFSPDAQNGYRPAS